MSAQKSGLLVSIAKAAIRDLFTPRSGIQPVDAFDADFSGAFVSIYVNHALRGCIGYMAKFKPLGQTIYELAQKAAAADTRFQSVQEHEVNQTSVEITILDPMEDIAAPDELEIGKHGVYIECGYHRGVLLPQVAGERGWTSSQFADAVCEKAMLEPGCWHKPECKLKRFTAQVIKQEQHQEGR